MTQQHTSQFHASEITVQERVGVADMVTQYSEGLIRKAMPQQHRDFFIELPFVILGLTDQQGYPWAMPLFGPEGFISSPTDTLLKLNTLPSLCRLLELNFKRGQKVGLLGIQLHTRRRNRMNGVIDYIGEDNFTIRVEQSFGNCPQYIQKRELSWKSNLLVQQDFNEIKTTINIDLSSKAFIEQADTFFISSRTKVFDKDSRSGIDVSHRGGKPGFVKVDGNRLYFPDFSGNKFFNTLGNIQSDNRVGLFFPDYSTGSVIFIVGIANVLWDDPAIDQFEGAERIVEISTKKVVVIPNFMPMTGKLITLSPALKDTGQWQDVKHEKNYSYQPLRLIKKQKESDAITSFYFSPIDDISTKDYIPGQFLPIQLTIPGKKSVLRSYTLSQAPVEGSYRISVKREAKGLASRFLHDQVNIGDVINAANPAGEFTRQKNNRAIVFISGGIGITPMIAMLEGIVNDFNRGTEAYPVWFIHASQNSETQAFSEQVTTLARQYDWLNTHTIFSQPLPTDKVGRTHHSEGRISIQLLKNILPFDHHDFYLCGSEGFMRDIYAGLLGAGVNKNNIYHEFFGEGSIDKPDETAAPVADKATITFSKAKISSEWTPDDGSLLEFAEKQGLSPLYSCRLGNCGACACKLSSGKVNYGKQPSFKPEEGEILMCCARPAENSSDIIIDI